MNDRLDTYRSKRNFKRTAEPSGRQGKSSEHPLYVMHKHAASHDHFDLRLEQDGVLRSWALPKGPSLKPGEKRLAVEVEDHPLEYGEFEGVIPEEEYGGGTSMLWDTGEWHSTGKEKADKLDFELTGEKLKGRWSLVKMQGKSDKNKKNWLLIKRTDDPPTKLDPDDRSVVSGRTMEEIAEEGNKSERSELPAAPSVQLATLVEQPPSRDTWIHEIKLDGYRLVARIEKGRVRLITRNGKDWTHRFPETARRLEKLPVSSALVDGEIVAQESNGATSFRKLQDALARQKGSGNTADLSYQLFDLLHLDGDDLRGHPLSERKQALEELLNNTPELGRGIRLSRHLEGNGKDILEQVCELGLEGIISKQKSASYQAGRQKSWVKTKCTQQDEFIVGGFTRPSGARKGFGSLLLGAFERDHLIYVGRVGSGFSTLQLQQLHRLLKESAVEQCPFTTDVPETKGVTWVKPDLVVDVEFTERTGSGALRHPVFRGIREDKSAQEITLTKPRDAPPTKTKDSPAKVDLTHPDRVLYPEAGITKEEIARYYEEIQDWILPHLKNRPLSLLRCPQGRDRECFFQKHPGRNFATGVPRITIEEKPGRQAEYLYVETIRDLIELVQFNVLEFHPWGSWNKHLETPDNLVFDMDPGPGLGWKNLVNATRDLGELLDSLGLPTFLQATGGKGLHIIVPIEPTLDWKTAKSFCHAVSRVLEQQAPERFTTNMAKAKREGRVFIDYLRNGRGNTSIARYSLRAREQAPVATPLRWDELSTATNANRYTLHTIRRRLSALKEDPWQQYENARTEIGPHLLKKLPST